MNSYVTSVASDLVEIVSYVQNQLNIRDVNRLRSLMDCAGEILHLMVLASALETSICCS